MGSSCTILAHVRRPDGEIVESRLFKDLLHYTANNRELAKEYYAVGTSESFLNKAREFKEFQTDENGEVTFSALRTIAKMDIESDKLMQVLNKDIGEGEYEYEEALRRIQDFNDNNIFSDKVIATMYPADSGKYYVTVVPQIKNVTGQSGKEGEVVNTPNERKKLHDVVHNEELERKLKALLRSHGVSVRFLEGNRKEGRYSTENIVKTSDGLYGLIELSKEGYTSEAFVEEAGHFAVGALGEHPLVQRLEKMLESTEAQKEALGEEEYNNSNLGNNPKREVAGRLVGKALQRKLDNSGPVRVLANRIANLAKRIFYRFAGNEVRWAAAKAEQLANKIAYGFVEGDNSFSVENAISIPETMHSTEFSVNQKAYKDVVDELGRMVKKLEAIAQDQFTGKMQSSLASAIWAGTDASSGESALQQVSTYADTFAFDGIVQALVQVTDYLGPDKEIDQLLKAVNLDNPSDFYANMARNGRYLRQARVFLSSADVIIDTIEQYLNERDPEVGTLKLSNGSSITDVRYQDLNGTWHSINMKNALSAYKNIIVKTTQELTSLESAYFARFCEDIYGSKYITSTVGKLWTNIWADTPLSEYTQSIAGLVRGEGMEDIDVFHRYLGSMANNPDVIGQIVDKLVKTANKTADDLTIRYQERLMVLQERAKQLGLNVADLVELDEDGVPTGNLITPPPSPTENGDREEDAIYDAYMSDSDIGESFAVHYGSWEKARDEFKKQAWEDFKAANPGIESMSGFIKGLKWDEYFRPKMKDWNKQNSVKVEIKDRTTGQVTKVIWVPNRIYQSDQWDNLKAKYPPKNGETLERWMYDYRKIKEELDSMLPVGATTSYRLPQFRGTFGNAIRNTKALESGAFKGLKAWGKTFGRRIILEMFGVESEETDYGDMTTMNNPDEELLGTKLDYEQERAARLPIFGINKLRDMRDLSSDIFHSTLAYASMATSYKCLDSVVDGLEVGKEALYNRKIRGKDTWIEAGGRKIGNKWKKATGRHETRENGDKNRAYGRYLKFLDKQVYGISASYWGIPLWGGRRILLNKIIRNISSLGGTLFLKGNVLGGTVNTLTGFHNIFKEAVTGDYFNSKDFSYANGYYFKHFPEMWAESGELRKNNKLSLFLEQMNAISNNREKFRNWHTTRSQLNNFYRMLGYLPYSSGDHYMQAMSYLAVAHGTTLYDTEGRAVSNLWNAYEKQENKDENGMVSGSTLKFARFNPLDAREITSQNLQKEGAFLKPVVKSTVDFEDWLIYQDPGFADETYRKNNLYLYNSWRDTYNATSDKELMQFRAKKYKMLTSILQKTEDYINAASPLVAVPVFSAEEQQYIDFKKQNPKYRNIGTGNYNDLLQVVRDDIYGLIWTKADESAYMDKCRETNDRLHGIYNEQDKTAWHQQWYTNAFLAMKGWVLGYLEMMYSNNHYSVALGRNTEGFSNTALKVFANGIRGMLGGKNSLSFWDMCISMLVPWTKNARIAMQKAGFSEEQNFNMRRWVSSWMLMGLLIALKLATAPPDKDEDEDTEVDPTTGLIYYLAMRTLLEQEAFLWPPEIFVQSGQILDFVPVGFAAVNDLYKLGEEGVGAIMFDETDKDYFYQRDDRNGRYEQYDSKFKHHLERLIPYYKNFWAVKHPYQASENYEFGRKLRSR